MRRSKAQRLRFGILAARDTYARHLMTDAQQDDLEGMEMSGWRVRDSIKAFNRECENIHRRESKGRPHVWLY